MLVLMMQGGARFLQAVSEIDEHGVVAEIYSAIAHGNRVTKGICL